MKAVGIVRRVDELGRIVLPKELRDTMDINVRNSLCKLISAEHYAASNSRIS